MTEGKENRMDKVHKLISIITITMLITSCTIHPEPTYDKNGNPQCNCGKAWAQCIFWFG